MSDCSNAVEVGVGAAQPDAEPASTQLSCFFPTAKIGAEAPESGGVELRILATGRERELYVSSSPPTAGAFWCKI